MPRIKRFNSKYADTNPDDIIDIDALLRGIGQQADGYQIINVPHEEKVTYGEDDLNLDDSSVGGDEGGGGGDDEPPKIRYYSPRDISPGGQARWLDKVRQTILRRRYEKHKDPIAASEKAQRSNYADENERNRNLIAAGYALISKTLRESPATRCPGCNGALNGGNINRSDADKDIQKMCPVCQNRGHTVSDPASFMYDIASSEAVLNKWKDVHDTICTPRQCVCPFKSFIDKNVRFNSEKPYELKYKDTHDRPGAPEPIRRMLRKTAVFDEYEPIADAFGILGGKEDQPLQMFDICHFLNFDTIQPDSNIKDFRERLGDSAYGDNEHVYNAGGGGRDKQSFALIVNADHKKGTADIIYHYRPMAEIRTERRERRKGRRGRRDIKFNHAEDAIDLRELPATPEGRAKLNLRNHVANIYDEIRGYMGERSPAQRTNAFGENSGGVYHYITDVPMTYLARINNDVAPAVMTSGSVTQTQTAGKLRGWYTGKSRRKKPVNPDKKMTVEVLYRGDHGFGREGFRRGQMTTRDGLTSKMMRMVAREADKRLGLTPGTELHDKYSVTADTPDRDFVGTYDTRPSGGSPFITPDSRDPGPGSGPIPTGPVTTPPSAPEGAHAPIPDADAPEFDGPHMHVPMVEEPPTIEDILENDPQKLLDIVKKSTNKVTLTEAQTAAVLNGINMRQNVSGGLEAMGVPITEDDY